MLASETFSGFSACFCDFLKAFSWPEGFFSQYFGVSKVFVGLWNFCRFCSWSSVFFQVFQSTKPKLLRFFQVFKWLLGFFLTFSVGFWDFSGFQLAFSIFRVVSWHFGIFKVIQLAFGIVRVFSWLLRLFGFFSWFFYFFYLSRTHGRFRSAVTPKSFRLLFHHYAVMHIGQFHREADGPNPRSRGSQSKGQNVHYFLCLTSNSL